MLLSLSGRSVIKIQYTSFPLFPVAYPFRIATQLQYYVKREKCKVNDVIFPSGCEAHAINLGNKNMKIGIFTGGTSVRSKNIFTDISRYPTGKPEIKPGNTCIGALPTVILAGLLRRFKTPIDRHRQFSDLHCPHFHSIIKTRLFLHLAMNCIFSQ